MGRKQTISFRMTDELVEQVDDAVEERDNVNRTQWLTEAVRRKLQGEEVVGFKEVNS